MKHFLLGTAAAALLALAAAPAANAAVILTFGQSVDGPTITALATGFQTTHIGATDVAVDVTQILGGVGTGPAFLDLSADSTSGLSSVGPALLQHFSGSFSINTAADNSGTNLLSGTFVDVTLGSGTSAVMAAAEPPGTVSFLSDVIAPGDLGTPKGLAFSFADVTPAIHTALGLDTLGSFRSSVSGTFSANVAEVPEPATLALLGVGLLGLAAAHRRRRA